MLCLRINLNFFGDDQTDLEAYPTKTMYQIIFFYYRPESECQ